jgi:peroxiredoxin Q/BCP
MIQEGNPIPEFSVLNQRGETISNNDLIGKKTVLYFYPKDDTPGCTAQACNLRDNYAELLAKGYTIFGISPDNEAKHNKFIAKYELPFDLLADTEQTMASAFGVWVEKSMYGRKYMGIARTTFIVNEKGIVEKVIEKVDTKNHSQQLG